MKRLIDRLSSGETLVADGAMGTMLFEKGLDAGQCPETVNLSNPRVLEEIAEAYLEAGADILETNTFGGSPLKLSLYGLEEKMEAINRDAVLAVRGVVGDRAYVAASCGPCGKLLKPYGDADPGDVYAGFRRQIECLVGAGADCICVETMTDLAEAKLAVSAAREVSPDIPILATMTFDDTPRGYYTIMGVSIEVAAAGLLEAGADVIGSNCGNGIDNMIAVAGAFRKCIDMPLIIQANAGLPETRDGRTVYTESPALMGERARDLLDLGVSIIGGCCGTTPSHIGAIRSAVDSLGKP